MNDDQIEKEGQHLRDRLDGERQSAGGSHRWRCTANLRSRVVAYAVACAADSESHGQTAGRLGLTQSTLSRWIRQSRRRTVGLRSVAIVPSTRRQVTPPAARPPLRLLTPHGFVVEGLDAELLASLLQVLG